MLKGTWTYLAVESDGILCAYTHMPVGLAVARRIYTMGLHTLMSPQPEHGLPDC